MERTANASTAATRQSASSGGNFSIKKILFALLRRWYWFVISLAIMCALAWYKVAKTPPVYQRTASILIKSAQKGGDETLRELGLTQTPINLVNEILMMNTSVVANEIVRRLDLDVDYLQPGTFYKKTVYGLDLPLKVRFLELNDNESASLHVDLTRDSSLVLSGFRRGGQTSLEVMRARLGDTLQTPAGLLAVIASPFYKTGATSSLDVERYSLGAASGRVRWRINAHLRNQQASIIDISYQDVSPARAEDVLSTLVSVYNENWMQDRNKRIVSTNEFIKDRLSVIEQELGEVESDISNFKSEHLILDVGQAGGIAMSQANETEQQVALIENRIYLLRSVRDYIIDPQNTYQQIPYSSGIGTPVIERMIFEYNTTVLERNTHLAKSSLQNPRIANYDKTLASLRESLLMTMDSELSLMRTQERNLQSTRSQAISKVAANPNQAKYLLSVERQQKVKESLYLFLLQKREENELSQAFTAYNTQLIEPPHGGWTPIEPVAKSIYLMAILLGLAIPAAVIVLREVLKSTVQSRDDLKQLTAPFVGEIPQVALGKNAKKQKKVKGKKAVPEVVVQEKNRDIINEAFRVARSNLEFMLGFNSVHKIIMVTSINQGSGKTFTTANLATAIGIKGKKVLAIDLDLRKASLSEYAGSPHKGISGYLSGKEDDYKSLIVPLGQIDLLPCGQLPPNPSELLYSPRFEQLMAAVREDYDFVFCDCPPVEIVADASIVNRFVDQTIFIIRAKVLDRAFLPEIEQWYTEKRYKNMSILLNGTDGDSGYGYSRYGYHRYAYGHVYGYGKTAYGSEVKES